MSSTKTKRGRVSLATRNDYVTYRPSRASWTSVFFFLFFFFFVPDLLPAVHALILSQSSLCSYRNHLLISLSTGPSVEMPEAIFSKGFVNPDPTSSSDASDDDDDDDTTPYERLARSREAEVNKNLDFHSRYDPAPYKENPFRRAIINGSRRSETPQEDEPSRSATEKGWTIHLPAKSKPPSRPVHAPARSGGSIPVADPNPGGRNLTSKQPGKVLGALTNDDKPQSKKASWGGWTSKGIPVIAAAPKAPKKSLSQSADEMMAKEMGKKRGKGKKDAEGEEKKKRKPPARSSTAGAAAKGKGKGKQKEEDKDGGKIVFGRIRESLSPEGDAGLMSSGGSGSHIEFPHYTGLGEAEDTTCQQSTCPFPTHRPRR